MVSLLKSDFGMEIKKQSLDERFNEKCVAFVKSVLSEILREQFAKLYSGALLPGFSRIRIKDSTKFMVPSTLEGNYRNCGGDVHSRSKAGVSIQYEYDLQSGEIIDLEITSADRNDLKDAGETADYIEKDDLIIRDLGYFSTPVLNSCMGKEAFFLSRLNSYTNVYDTVGNQISFSDIYKAMKESGMIEKEMKVCVGKQTKLPVRLIIQLVPEEVYAQRIREKTRKCKGQGREQPTEESKIRCRFNLFITNAEESSLSIKQVYPLYRLRWQIELAFKNWKSVFKVDTLHKMKEHRYITLLYVKLIQIIINLQITYSVQQAFIQPKKDKIKVISLNKALKTLKTLFDKIFSILRGTRYKAQKMAQYIQDKLLDNHWLESKKGKSCLPEILQSFICVSKK
jgi:hypothetical protein